MPASEEQQKITEPTTLTEQKGTVTRVGNLANDPELRFAKDGKKKLARMRLAVQRPVKAGDWAGERVTKWYDVTAFDSLAEHCTESLRKGHRVIVHGRAQQRTWTGDDGDKRTQSEIIANAVGPDLRWQTAEVARGNTRPTDHADEDDEEF